MPRFIDSSTFTGVLRLAAVVVLSLLTGCATITRGTKEVLVVESTPPGADVRTTLGLTGTTPATFKVSRKGGFAVTIEKEHYEPVTVQVESEVAGSGAAGMAGNVVLGGLIGLAVDAGSGSTLRLVPNPIQVELQLASLPHEDWRRRDAVAPDEHRNTGPMVAGLRTRPPDDAGSQDYGSMHAQLRLAATNGSELAEYDLGVAAHRGYGRPIDHAVAVVHYTRAADSGVLEAQNNLGVLSELGLGTLQDFSAAARWYLHAAERGCAEAQWNLARLYVEGRGVESSPVEAYRWYNLAAAAGIPAAVDARDSLAQGMTREQLRRGQELSNQVVPVSEPDDSQASL